MTKLFFSYSHSDENLRDTLEKHLSALQHQGLIEPWHDRRIVVGDELEGTISKNLENADIILLLVSSDFIASRYCYDVEMKRAVARHNAGEARVIPVILRPCDWHDTPFGKLLAAPKDGKAITTWPNLDEAFLDVTLSIKKAIKELSAAKPARYEPTETPAPMSSALSAPVFETPRSSNLRMKREFSEADTDKYLDRAFEFMASFFEATMTELEKRNPGYNCRFKRVDGNRFTAVIYENGNAVARCKVALRGSFGNTITYSSSDRSDDNSFNESLSVEHDDQQLYLKAMGMPHFGQSVRDAKLTEEGAAEYYWSLLIGRLQ